MIAILGGSFDPIHDGHIHLARQILTRYSLNALYFVPAKQNPLKGSSPRADGRHRIEMVRLALRETGEPRFGVLDWEVTRSEPSYTILTLERLLLNAPSPVALIMGNEVFQCLPQWHEAARIPRVADIIVVTREKGVGANPTHILAELGIMGASTLPAFPCRTLHSKGEHWIDVVEISALPISATALRMHIAHLWKTGTLPETLQGVQRSVWQYIKENRLYAVTNEYDNG